MRHIVILAARRSGSTAFWRVFRDMPGVAAYDEPFNPLLGKLPHENENGTRRELIALYKRDPGAFRAAFAPVPQDEETTQGMTERQRAWLSWLLSHGPAVIDVTRCHGKIEGLHASAPDAVFVHLYRRPASFVTSHVLRSNMREIFGIRRAHIQRTFFTRTSGFNEWKMEDLLTGPQARATRELLDAEGVRAPGPRAPAALLLLGYWLGCYRRAEREGTRLYGPRFFSVGFEDFCGDPEPRCRAILECAGGDASAVHLSHLGAPRRGYEPVDPRWTELAAAAGFSAQEIERFFDHADRA